VDEYILGLDVPVDYLIELHGFEGLTNLIEYQHGLLFRQLSILLLQILVQTAPVAEFQKHVYVVRGLGYIEYLHYML
jgi:hypothetical protein